MEEISCKFRGYTVPTKTHVCMNGGSPFFHCAITEDCCGKCRQLSSGSRGLGDTVAKVAQATGIKQVVQKLSEITGVPCGCEERQEALNKLFPYSNSNNK